MARFRMEKVIETIGISTRVVRPGSERSIENSVTTRDLIS